MINACLQRRVWYFGEGEESEGGRLFPNLYVVLVGPPGNGKGKILDKVSYFLKYHKYDKGTEITTNTGGEKQSLFAVGADSITFEELLEDIANSTRTFRQPDGKAYIHTSYAFALQELDSLFRKKADDIGRFLKNAYDCVPYDRKTKHSGQNLLRRLCLSLIAGTQFDFVREATSGQYKIFGQGFSSRTLWIFEPGYTDDAFHISDLSEQQKEARDDLAKWISKLSLVYGELTYNDDARGFLEDWYKKKLHAQRAKASPKMQEYYARKKVMLLKMAAAVHFSDSLDMEISLMDFQRALVLLDSIEPAMEAGMNASGGKNELHNYAKDILEWITTKGGKATRREIILRFTADLSWEELEQCLRELEIGHGLRTKQENNEKIYYI